MRVDSGGWGFYVGDGGQPAGGTQADTALAAKAAAATWHRQKSPCTRGDYTYVPELTYIGTDDREGDFKLNSEGDSVCNYGHEDSASTIDAGDLNPSRVTGMTCAFRISQPGTDTVRTADIRFNTADHDFTYTPMSRTCSNDYDVQSTMTHEMGHVLGIDDNYASDATYQTMSGGASPCRSYKRTLGDGDVAALMVHY